MFDLGVLILSLLIVLLSAYICLVHVPVGMVYLRNGLGGQRVLLQGIAWAIPGVHQLLPLSLQTYSLELLATGEKSLRTKDLLRIDVSVVASIRLSKQPDMILTAARTWGKAGLESGVFKRWCETDYQALIETTVASHTLEALHQHRKAFLTQVTLVSKQALAQYGFELVSLSLVRLEQTETRFYDPTNYLDVKGLALLEQMQLSYAKQRKQQQGEAELSDKRFEFDVALERMEWERKEFLARLQHIRFKAEADAKAEQALEEIHVAKELALEMIQRDIALTRLQTEREVAAVRTAMG